MKYRLYFLISLIIVITIVFPACSNKTSSNTEAPLIDVQNVAEMNWSTKGTVNEATISSQKGGTIQQSEVSIVVPPGSLSEDSKVSIKEFTEAPPPDMPQGQDTTHPIVVSISKVYDLGPAGTKFNKPVEVTVAYDKSYLNDGVDSRNISFAYFNGKNWIAAGGLVDTQKGTVTIALNSFPGEIITVVVGTIMTGAVTWAGAKAYQYWKGDPIKQNNAKEFITPNNPTVGYNTLRAGAMGYEEGKRKWIPLEDPNNPGQINPAFKDYANIAYKDRAHTNQIGFGGSATSSAKYPTYSEEKNFQMPEEFFKSMTGDCTAVACAYTSMLRRLGIKAYAVDGYKSNTGQGAKRHAWVEFYLDGEIYYCDNEEGVIPLSEVDSTLKRPTDIKYQGYMWNELGQEKYTDFWWEKVQDAVWLLTPDLTRPGDNYDNGMIIRYELFSKAYLSITDGRASASQSRSVSIPDRFDGTSFLEMDGTYDSTTGVLTGAYEWGYGGDPHDDTYIKERVVYSGNFKGKFLSNDKQVLLEFNGDITVTRTPKKGQPWTFTEKGGLPVNYIITRVK